MNDVNDVNDVNDANANDDVLTRIEDGVGVVTLNRPELANAQDLVLLRHLDECLAAMAKNSEVKVILLNANGKHFSAGHDMNPKRDELLRFHPEGPHGLADLYTIEREVYIGFCQKWRNIPQPTIAAVQGACIAAGLMLAWPCDLIIAADTAYFSDPVVNMGIGGVEYHCHAWEFGHRKAKELLFTSDRLSAEEAQKLGMVNRVVPADQLQKEALELAKKVATKPAFGLQMAKRAVNQAMDIGGQEAAQKAIFDIHSVGHGHALSISGIPVLVGLEELKKSNRK